MVSNNFSVVIYLILFLITLWLVINLYLLVRKEKKISFAIIKKKKEIHYLNYLTSDAVSNDRLIETSFPEYLDRLKEEVEWKYHSLWNIDENNQVVKLRFTGYLPGWYVEELSKKLLIKIGDSSIGRAISTKQPATINEAPTDPRFTNVSSYGVRAGYLCLSCYPLIGKLKTIGGFCAYGEKLNMFTLHDVKFLLTCANVYAIILENKLLDNYLKKQMA